MQQQNLITKLKFCFAKRIESELLCDDSVMERDCRIINDRKEIVHNLWQK